ncbi:hypothetical protein [Streptomyces kebangsaanensis]|uniref:hypothetical protein n=1 Tax=Streptomyces kebangsaanensis TaxID=864058 RepID=UPI000A7F9107|nr:hypothetical protein [Streptomyces kebangsaanensis]
MLRIATIAYRRMDATVPARQPHARRGATSTTAKETLRHSTITLTSDTCTSPLLALDRAIAEKATKLVSRFRPADADQSARTAENTQAAGTSAHA